MISCSAGVAGRTYHTPRVSDRPVAARGDCPLLGRPFDHSEIVSDRSPNDGLIGLDEAARAAQVDLDV